MPAERRTAGVASRGERMKLALFVAVLCIAGSASAQQPACGPASQPTYQVRWKAPTSGPTPTAYFLVGQSTLLGDDTTAQVQLSPGAPVNGVLTANATGFHNALPWSFTVIAQLSPTSTAPISNAIVVPAGSRPCTAPE